MKFQENQCPVFILLIPVCLSFIEISENLARKDQVQRRQKSAPLEIRYFYSFIFLIEILTKKKRRTHHESNLNVQ